MRKVDKDDDDLREPKNDLRKLNGVLPRESRRVDGVVSSVDERVVQSEGSLEVERGGVSLPRPAAVVGASVSTATDEYCEILDGGGRRGSLRGVDGADAGVGLSKLGDEVADSGVSEIPDEAHDFLCAWLGAERDIHQYDVHG